MKFTFLACLTVILFAGCGGLQTRLDYNPRFETNLRQGKFENASTDIELDRKHNLYQHKDRVLYYLDKGAVQHFAGHYTASNQLFDRADRAMEDLFTRSVLKAVISMLTNDNVLDYTGEIYENIYVNILKTLNYLHQNNFDAAYVEVRRLNDKLARMDDQYSRYIEKLNEADTLGIRIEKQSVKFYQDALANYLSFLIFRAEGEEDNARISFEQAREAFQLYPNIYDSELPTVLKNEPRYSGTFLNLITFTSPPPFKTAVGAKITTYKDKIHVSDLSGYHNNLLIPIPGIREGFHIKFEFPELHSVESKIERIEIIIDDDAYYEMDLLEDIGRVAKHTFESKKNIIYFKTLIRTLSKSIAATRAKKKLRKKAEVKDDSFWGTLINFGVDALVDATEKADLRHWRAMPGRCYVSEIPLEPGKHNITVRFMRSGNLLLQKIEYPDFEVTAGFNLIEPVCLN